MSQKPNSGCQILVFRPTMEEFSDFSRYIQYMESQGAHRGGVAKIIPPKEWSPTKSYDNIDNLQIPAPISQVVTGQKGLYTQYNIQQKPMTVKEMRRLTNTDRYASPFHENYEDLERTYWKNITFNPAIYGADISGSLYNKDVDVWNVARLDTILDLVENDTGVKIEGVNTAYLYFGMWKTSFAWHTEDMDLYSINYVHFGAPKTWYSVPPEHGKRLERLAAGFFPNSNSTCPSFLRHKMTLISPLVLKQYGIPFNKITQEAGEFMITFPYGYHSGFNHGFNCAESTNFASERWIDYGVASEKCRCRKDMVYINMELFVKTFRPEKYECWKNKKHEVKLSYTDIPPVPDFTTKPTHWRKRVEEIRRANGTPKKASASRNKTPQKVTSSSPAKAKQSPFSPKKESVKRPLGISKMPLVRLVKTDLVQAFQNVSPSSSPAKKSSTRRALSVGSAEKRSLLSSPGTSGCLLGSPKSSSFQIKMGTVLPMELVSSQSLPSTSAEHNPTNFPTLVDRIKMSRRKLPSESSSTSMLGSLAEMASMPQAANCISNSGSIQLPPNSDHNMYTKRASESEHRTQSSTSEQKYFPPLPVKIQIMNPDGSPFSHLQALPPEMLQFVLQNSSMSMLHAPKDPPASFHDGIKPEITQAENQQVKASSSNHASVSSPVPVPSTPDIATKISSSADKVNEKSAALDLRLKIETNHATDIATSSKSKSQAEPSQNSPLVMSRPPLKRRHPVSKKGPSKKSSPSVVLKNTSAESESSDDDSIRQKSKAKKRPGRPKTKQDDFVETEGYPTLWPRRKANYKTEKKYNSTVAKLSPHCAICTVFYPYYQRSLTSDEKPPPLSDLLRNTAVPPPGTKTKPLIPEIIFATSTDNPAPLATCELLDEDGKSALIQCKVCKVQVHASCYGILRPENPWTCDRCSFKALTAQCCLCCMRGGALKPVNDGQQWAHILCALAISEVSFDDIPRRNGINIKNLSQARQKLRCTYCRRNKSRGLHLFGTCIQCCAGACAISFHPTCAHAAGVKMEPGDWPLPVFVYCHRHALMKERATELKGDKALPEVSLEQKVYGKHRNGRYYPCVIQSEESQTFHHVIFADKSWSDNLFGQDITSHDFAVSPPKRGAKITVKWTDGKLYKAEYVRSKKHQVLDVEFEDGSILSIKREDVYTSMDDMPKRIRRKLSNATLMSDPDYLESPKKPTDPQSYVSQRAAFNEKRKLRLAALSSEILEENVITEPANSKVENKPSSESKATQEEAEKI